MDASLHLKPLVLVVDDDPVHHKLFSLIADRLDITAHLVWSGLQALEVIETHAFDLILMDCRMPDLDGYTCTRKIRDSNHALKNIPIIGVTACVMAADRDKCFQSGMNDFLGKPFTLEQLNRIIQVWLPVEKRK